MQQDKREQRSGDAGTLGDARRPQPDPSIEEHDAIENQDERANAAPAGSRGERELPEEKHRAGSGHMGDGRNTGGGIGGPGVRQDPPGSNEDLDLEESQGFTGEIGDRKRQFPGSEAQRRKVSPDDPEQHTH